MDAAAIYSDAMMHSSRFLNRRILLVEDLFLVADKLVHILNEWGCEVIGPARTLSAALYLSHVPQIDGALLDVYLGDVTVFPLATELTARNIPFLFLTAYGTPSVFPPEFEAVPRLMKPISPSKLAAAITSTFFERL
jgi:two-component SAPR family response regulator